MLRRLGDYAVDSRLAVRCRERNRRTFDLAFRCRVANRSGLTHNKMGGPMAEKIPQTNEELERQFQEQLKFVRRSAEYFDQGEVSEAKRIAVSLRVLLHQTKQSHSLLTQTGRTGQLFYSSIEPDDDDNILAYAPLVGLATTSSGATVVPRLDDFVSGTEQRIPFVAWWEQTAYRDKRDRKLSRRELTLTMANQDGGAHVDPGLDPRYHGLSRGPGVDVQAFVGDEAWEFSGTELASVRQIGHEVLKSFDPKLEAHRSPTAGAAVFMLQPKIVIPGMGPFIRHQNESFASTGKAPKPGRNDPCPCGSGRKWKKCHGGTIGTTGEMRPFVRVK
jgi:hypothetical protein